MSMKNVSECKIKLAGLVVVLTLYRKVEDTSFI